MDSINIKIKHYDESDDKKTEIIMEILPGRQLWLEQQKHVLTKTAKILLSYKWGIAEPAANIKWVTSDNPVTRLNSYGNGKYDFKGGWGKQNTDIFMPITPNYLLFTEVGQEVPKQFTLPPRLTYTLQKCIVENAHRMIFAHQPIPFICKLRPRHVDYTDYHEEQTAWKNWHKDQTEAEHDLHNG